MSRAFAHTKAKYSEIIGKTILMRKVKKSFISIWWNLDVCGSFTVFCWSLWKVDFNRRECTAITKNLSNLVRIYSSFLNAISFNWTIFLLIFTSNITAIFLMNLTTIILFTNAISYFNTLKKLNNLERKCETIWHKIGIFFRSFCQFAICNTREWIA